MNIERIVAHLIARNTDAPDLKQELLEEPVSKRTKRVLSLIAVEWSKNGRLKDLYDYALFEIPEPYVYCFFNIRNHKRFDVYLNDYNGNGNSCTFGYVDSRSVTQDAQNSDEAIREYLSDF